VGFVSRIVVTRLASGRVATVRVAGLEMKQDVYIGRNNNLPGTTAQNAFWSFVTDPSNPILLQLAQYGFEYAFPDLANIEL
jgi:hypothetical protein